MTHKPAIPAVRALVSFLFKERMDQGISQRDVALNSHGTITGTMVSRYETNRMTPRMPNFLMWADGLGYELIMVRKEAEDVQD